MLCFIGNTQRKEQQQNAILSVVPDLPVCSKQNMNEADNRSSANQTVRVQVKAVNRSQIDNLTTKNIKNTNKIDDCDIDVENEQPLNKKKKTTNSKVPALPVYNIQQAMSLQTETNNILKHISKQNNTMIDLLTKLVEK